MTTPYDIPVRDDRRQRFVMIDNVVITHYARRIGTPALAVYVGLVHAAHDGAATTRHRTLVAKLGIGEATVRRSITTLAEPTTDGLPPLIRVQRRRADDGSTLANRYVLLDVSSVTGADQDGAPPDHTDQPPLTDLYPRGVPDPIGQLQDVSLPQTDTPQPSEDRPQVGAYAIVQEWMRLTSTDRPANMGKALRCAKQLLGAGMTIEGMTPFVAWLYRQTWLTSMDLGTALSQYDRYRSTLNGASRDPYGWFLDRPPGDLNRVALIDGTAVPIVPPPVRPDFPGHVPILNHGRWTTEWSDPERPWLDRRHPQWGI